MCVLFICITAPVCPVLEEAGRASALAVQDLALVYQAGLELRIPPRIKGLRHHHVASVEILLCSNLKLRVLQL